MKKFKLLLPILVICLGIVGFLGLVRSAHTQEDPSTFERAENYYYQYTKYTADFYNGFNFTPTKHDDAVENIGNQTLKLGDYFTKNPKQAMGNITGKIKGRDVNKIYKAMGRKYGEKLGVAGTELNKFANAWSTMNWYIMPGFEVAGHLSEGDTTGAGQVAAESIAGNLSQLYGVWGGAKMGAVFGAPFGGIGAPVGACIGGVLGSFVGGKVQDVAFKPLIEKIFGSIDKSLSKSHADKYNQMMKEFRKLQGVQYGKIFEDEPMIAVVTDGNIALKNVSFVHKDGTFSLGDGVGQISITDWSFSGAVALIKADPANPDIQAEYSAEIKFLGTIDLEAGTGKGYVTSTGGFKFYRQRYNAWVTHTYYGTGMRTAGSKVSINVQQVGGTNEYRISGTFSSDLQSFRAIAVSGRLFKEDLTGGEKISGEFEFMLKISQ